MAEINLNLDNQNIINDYFDDLTCDDYKESIFKGGQSFADQALNNLDISGYAKKKKQCIPFRKKRIIILITIYKTWFIEFKRSMEPC